MTDEELMRSFCRSPNDSHFEELVRRYAEPAWNVAAALLGSRAAAEDAVQEAFLRVIRAKDTYRRGMSFRNWFYAILRNVCRDELRRPAESQPPEDDAIEPAVDCDPAAPAFRREEIEAARAALGRLPDHEQEVLALRFYGDLDFADIAACCGITSNAARQRASRGLNQLRGRLRGKAVTLREPVRNLSMARTGRN